MTRNPIKTRPSIGATNQNGQTGYVLSLDNTTKENNAGCLSDNGDGSPINLSQGVLSMIHPPKSRMFGEIMTPAEKIPYCKDCDSCPHCEKATLINEEGEVGEVKEFSHCSSYGAQRMHIGINCKTKEDLLQDDGIGPNSINCYAFPVERIYESCEGRYFDSLKIKAGNGDQATTPPSKKWDCKYCKSYSRVAVIWADGIAYELNECCCDHAQYAMIQSVVQIEKHSPGPWDRNTYVYPANLVRPFCKGLYFVPNRSLYDAQMYGELQ